MDTDDPHLHDALFTTPALKLGLVHWYLTRAASEIEAKSHTRSQAGPDGAFTVTHLTSFGELIRPDEVQWWVWTRESNLSQLRDRTAATFPAAQRLQRASRVLSRSSFDSYAAMLQGITDFAAGQGAALDEVLDYVRWLHSRDELAPAMLFSTAEWGTTRVSDRWAEPSADSLTNPRAIEHLSELAWGVRDRMWGYVIDAERMDLLGEMADAYSDYEGTISVPDDVLLPRVVHTVLHQLSEYFEFIRNSFRNIANAVDQRLASQKLIVNETFWRGFLAKVRHTSRTETQTWDFKELLDFWIAPKNKRESAKRKFCELVSAFANANGGVFIIGVRNRDRTVVGVADVENRVKYTRQVLDECFGRSVGFVAFQQVVAQDETGDEQACLAIVVAQTREVTSVRDENDVPRFPLRQETGLVRVQEAVVAAEKAAVRSTNFDFLQTLYRWSIDA
jgi:hypothetical protein